MFGLLKKLFVKKKVKPRKKPAPVKAAVPEDTSIVVIKRRVWSGTKYVEMKEKARLVKETLKGYSVRLDDMAIIHRKSRDVILRKAI